MGKTQEILVPSKSLNDNTQNKKSITKILNTGNAISQNPRQKQNEQNNKLLHRLIIKNQYNYLDENIFQKINNGTSKGKEKQTLKSVQNKLRKPFSDITNVQNSQKINKLGSESDTSSSCGKQTSHYTYLTYLDQTALKQLKICLYVDTELGIPSQFANKIQSQTIDNDIETDEEQIKNATKKLKQALEEEVYMNKHLEKDLLEQIMFEEIERWETIQKLKNQEQKLQSLLETFDIKNSSIEQLFENIFIKYQNSCQKPFKMQQYELLLYQTIEKTIPKLMDDYKKQGSLYQQYKNQKQLRMNKQHKQKSLEKQYDNKQQSQSISIQYSKDQNSNVSTQFTQENLYINYESDINNLYDNKYNSPSKFNQFELVSDVSSIHKISTSNLLDFI